MKSVSISSAHDVLENFYELDGTMPQELTERVSPTHTNNMYSNISSPNRSQREEQAIQNMFKDPRLTLEQREKLSASILHGKFELVEEALQSRSKPKLKETDQEKIRIAELTLARHRLPKPSFLQVVTQSANIPVMSGREARTQKLNIQHRMGTPSPAPEVPQPLSRKEAIRRRASSDMNDSTFGPEMFPKPSLKELQNHLVAEHNRNRLERSKQDTKLRTEHANQLKQLETATNEKRMEVKKKLHEVRKSLRAHLVNTRDPQLGTIMRLVDESLIYHFMEKYSGFSMTAQAILSLIGSSMNTNLMNPSICEEDKPMNTLQAELNGGSPGRKGTKTVPILNFDDSRGNTPVASASRLADGRVGATTAPVGGSTAAAGSSVYMSRGRSRGLLDSTSAVASIPRTARQRGRITNSTEFLPTEKRIHSSCSRGTTEKIQHTAMTDPVTGFSPRKYHADRPLSPENKAWGGGFRVVLPRSDSPPSPMKPLVPMTVTRPASLPGKSRSFSPSQSRKAPGSAGHAGKGQRDGSNSLVLFGSENVRLTARSMGFTIEGLSITDDLASNHVDDGDHHSVTSHHTHHTVDSYHTSVPSNAIAAMHEQLIEENILPSMQPELVLSQAQLEDLGLHKKSFNEILNEISKASVSQSQVTLSTDPALAIETPGLSQYNSAPQSRINSARISIDDSLCGSPREDESRGNGGDMYSEASSPVKELVSGMMRSSDTRKSLFVTPLSETALVPPPPKNYATLYGSVYTAEDKERFQHLSALEVERAEQRHGIDRQPPSPHRISFGRPYEGSPGKLPQLAPLTQPPRAIKTKSGLRDELNNPIPESPYMSYEEECRVQNTGVPAGAGMMLWRPRYRVSNDGRYRAGQSRTRIRSSLQKGPTKRPFVSSA